MSNKKLLALIDQLRKYDHAFLSEEGVKHFTKPFGFEGSVYLASDNRSQFKGLNFGPDHKEGDKKLGQDAARTAWEICDHLKLRVPEMFGRGSQLQVCCQAIENSLRN